MIDNKKKIVVMMTTYNPKEYLLEQVKSVLEQKMVNVELIIRDDCSTDKFYLEKIKLIENVKVIEGKHNLGVGGNIQELLRYAFDNYDESMNYFAYCDQDDVWFSDKLKVAIDRLDTMNKEKPCLYYSNLLVTDAELKPSHNQFKSGIVRNQFSQAYAQVFVFACTTVFNKKMLDELVKYDINEIEGLFDYLIYYLAILYGDIYYDETPHIFYRQHGDNVSGQKRKGIPYVLNKLKVFPKSKNDSQIFKKMAVFALKHFSEYLSNEQKEVLEKLATYNTLKSRLDLIFDKHIDAGYQPKRFFCNLRLLLNRY
jgi:rhamnosyltransferase